MAVNLGQAASLAVLHSVLSVWPCSLHASFVTLPMAACLSRSTRAAPAALLIAICVDIMPNEAPVFSDVWIS